MPNELNRPAGPDCDHAGYTGCTSCGCSECGALVDRDQLGPLTHPSGMVTMACAECRAAGESDGIPPVCGRCGGRTDGVKPEPTFGGMRLAACDCAVPEAIEGEVSGAQTVRLESDPSIKATGRDWAEQLSKEVA